MLFLKKLFGTGRPVFREETTDRSDYDVSADVTPEKIERIMLAANSGDVADQCRLSREILEKNADIAQAMSTRKNAVIGCGWRLEPGDGSDQAREAALRLRQILLECGSDGSDAFEDLLDDLLGALLPGFAASEILWTPGGGIAGFHHLDQKHFSFTDGFAPKLVTSDHPGGIELDRRRVIFHRVRFHGTDPARGGLIRPLAWLHCFKTVGEKDLLSFIERHGMPFIAAKVDETTFEREKNLVKRLIRNFGSSGGGIFTKNVELQLLESTNSGDAYFRLLDYLDAAVNKVILGQTASSGDSSGLSKGDAQSKVRQDILEADCRILQRTINAQLLKPWTRYNFGENVASPLLVINCQAPEDLVASATTLRTLYEAGFEADPEEVSERFGWSLRRRPDPVAPPAALSMSGTAPAPGDAQTESKIARALDAWLSPLAEELGTLTDDLSDQEYGARLDRILSEVPGDDAPLAELMTEEMREVLR